MLYYYNNGFVNADFSSVKPEYPVLGLISPNEFEVHYLDFGLSQTAFKKFCKNDPYFRSKIEIYDDYIFGTIRIVEAQIDNDDEIELAFYIKNNLFLVIEQTDKNHFSHEYFASAVSRLSSSNFTMEKFIFSFLDNIIADDGIELETLEFEIDKLEDDVLNSKNSEMFNETILQYKKKLLSLRNYYEQLVYIGEELSENEDDVFSESNLRYFKIFSEKADRLSSNVNLLKESIIQLREVYQSNLDLKLNNTMKIFTVVTSIFLPLTLIVGWYGMNFKYMPELTWRYGYLCVIGVSVLTVLGCILFFKKKKLF